MKRILHILLFFVIIYSINVSTSFAFYETLPKDIGSNSNIMEIISPKEKETVNYSDTYIISCIATPGTEITLYEKYDDTVYIPMLIDNEAITNVVGESGLFLINLTFKPNSKKTIMIFAQNGTKYQSAFRTIAIKEKEVVEKIEYKVINIKDFVVTKP